MSTDAKVLSFVSPLLFPGTVHVCVTYSRDVIYARNVIRHTES